MAARYDMHEAVQDIWVGLYMKQDLPEPSRALENAEITRWATQVRDRNAELRLW